MKAHINPSGKLSHLRKGWFTLTTAVCIFRSRLHQRRDRKIPISLWKCSCPLRNRTSVNKPKHSCGFCSGMRREEIGILYKHLQNFKVGRSTIWYKKISFHLCCKIMNLWQKFEKLWKTKNFELVNFRVLVISQFSCRFFSNFFESNRNGLIDGRKNAGA